MEDINLVSADTEVTNLDRAILAAATFAGGNAVKKACEMHESNPSYCFRKTREAVEDLDLQNRMVICLRNAEKKMPISDNKRSFLQQNQ
jgi:hypothetical protein